MKKRLLSLLMALTLFSMSNFAVVLSVNAAQTDSTGPKIELRKGGAVIESGRIAKGEDGFIHVSDSEYGLVEVRLNDQTMASYAFSNPNKAGFSLETYNLPAGVYVVTAKNADYRYEMFRFTIYETEAASGSRIWTVTMDGTEVSPDSLSIDENYNVRVNGYEFSLLEVRLDGKIISYGSDTGFFAFETRGLAAGTHTVTAKDSAGRTTTFQFTIVDNKIFGKAVDGLVQRVALTTTQLTIEVKNGYIFDGSQMVLTDKTENKRHILEIFGNNPDVTGINTNKIVYSNLRMKKGNVYEIKIPEHAIVSNIYEPNFDWKNFVWNKEYVAVIVGLSEPEPIPTAGKAVDGLVQSVKLTSSQLTVEAKQDYQFDGSDIILTDLTTNRQQILGIWSNNPDVRGVNTSKIVYSNLQLTNGHSYEIKIKEHAIVKRAYELSDFIWNKEYVTTVKLNDPTVQTQPPITWGAWFDGVQFGTQLGEGVYAINDGVWQVFSPKSDSKILLSTDYSLCDVRITKINDNATTPTNNTAHYDYELVVFSQDFPVTSKSTALEINVGGLNLSNGTYVIEYTNKSGNLRFWYPFVIYRNSSSNTVPTQPHINTYYSRNAVKGAKIGNRDIALNFVNDMVLVPTFNPKNISKLTISTDKNFLFEVLITKQNRSTSPKQSWESIIESNVDIYHWEFGANSNCNVVEINLSGLNLEDGTYMITGWNEFSPSGVSGGFNFVFIIDKNYISPVTPHFSDVPATHWAYDSIMSLVDKGVISGYDNGTFKPDGLVSRSEFATMMTRALQIPLVTNATPTFVDVGRNDWEFVYVETAKKYLTGYQQGNSYYFKGKERAVREDMAVALVKALKLENQQVDVNELKKIYTDYSSISPNLQKYVLIAYKNNLMGGYPDGTFGAQKAITRAETASLLIRVLNSEAIQKVTFN